MPYDIRRHNGQACLFKPGSDTPVKGSCHRAWAKTAAMRRAILASEHSQEKAIEMRSMVKALNDRYMVIVSSNSYRDREKEWIETEALKRETDSWWKDGEFVIPKESSAVLYWHKGPVIARVIWADMFGPFRVEIAEKRQSIIPVIQTYIDRVWTRVQREVGEWGASIGFLAYLRSIRPDPDGKTYIDLFTKERSVLRRLVAANILTFSEVLQ